MRTASHLLRPAWMTSGCLNNCFVWALGQPAPSPPLKSYMHHVIKLNVSSSKASIEDVHTAITDTADNHGEVSLLAHGRQLRKWMGEDLQKGSTCQFVCAEDPDTKIAWSLPVWIILFLNILVLISIVHQSLEGFKQSWTHLKLANRIKTTKNTDNWDADQFFPPIQPHLSNKLAPPINFI